MHAKQPAAAEHLLCNGVIMMHFNEERITSAPPPLPNLTAVVPPLLPDEAWRSSFFFFCFLSSSLATPWELIVYLLSVVD